MARPRSNASRSYGLRPPSRATQTDPDDAVPTRGETSTSDLGDRPGFLSQPISELLLGVLDEIEAVGTRKATGTFRVPTGFDDLDNLLGGWSQGSLVVIGGRPSSGKTTLLLNFCEAASIKYGLPSMLVSGEMNGSELQSRLLSAEARVPVHAMRTGQMNDEDWSRLARVITLVADAPIHIGTPSECRIEQLSAEVAAIVRKTGLKLLLIDSLQWIIDQSISPQVSMEFSLRRLKKLAETLTIPVIITAQAERLNSGDYTIASPVQQLKDGNVIERVADVVIILDRPDQDNLEHPRAGEADLIVVKNRNGPVATISVAYQGHYCRFVTMVSGNYSMFPTSLAQPSMGDSTDLQQVTIYDREIYQQFLGKLSPDGPVIEWLKRNFMIKSLPWKLFVELEQTVKARDLDPIGFDNEEVNNSYVHLVETIENFCSTASSWTWLDGGQHWLSIPLEWREDDPERWRQASDAILKDRDSVIKQYDEFLLTCHRNNIDHPLTG